MSKQKFNAIVIIGKKKKKRAVKRSKTEKNWLRLGLNPQLSWLTAVCQSSFDRTITAVLCLLSTPVPSTCCKGQMKADITIVEFNFAQVLFRCVLRMPSNSAIKAVL